MKTKKETPRSRIVDILFYGAIFFAIIWVLFIDDMSFWTIHTEKKREQELIKKIDMVKGDNAALSEQLENMKANNAAWVEKIAREEFRMKYKGEKAYYIIKLDEKGNLK